MPEQPTILALCEEVFSTQLGRLWWRCSMSKTGATKMVKQILAALDGEALASCDEWPPIEEFMHDFPASSHSIPEITGKAPGYTWDNRPFRLIFAAESEMKNGGPEARAHAITRDLVKLCLVECPIKAVILFVGQPGHESLTQG